jgi:membrane-associated protease RseP (regulator of RpoE activity)
MSDQSSPEILAPSEIYSPGEHEVVCVSRLRPKYWLHILLLIATFFTTLMVGARLEWNFEHGLPPFLLDESIFPSLNWVHHLALGIPFSLTLMGILLAHELGHYFYCVKYRVAATLPFFIPVPTLIGTLGAFIRIRSPLRSRSILFDIGIAGPIAGFAVALPVLFFSLGRSHIAPPGVALPRIELGYPLVFHLAQKFLAILSSGNLVATVPLARLYLSPVAIAAWVGMFATSLNLLPGGQLDGGHIVFAVCPRSHRMVSRITILALIPLALFFWTGWIVWAILLRVSGMRHPTVSEWPDITPMRRVLAACALCLLILTFTYLPIAPSDSDTSLLGSISAIFSSSHHTR